MRAVGEPGAWSEAEQRAFCLAPTLPEAIRAVEAVRRAQMDDHAQAYDETWLDTTIASVGFVIFLGVSLLGAGAALYGLRALWRLVR